MSSIKNEIETGTSTVETAKKVTTIIITIAIGSLLLGLAIGGTFF